MYFQKDISSSFFQYSDRTVASTETNDTATERSDTQLYGARKSEGMALSRRFHTNLPQKDIEKKLNLTELSQGAKIFFLITQILFSYYELHCTVKLGFKVLFGHHKKVS